MLYITHKYVVKYTCILYILYLLYYTKGLVQGFDITQL